MSQETPASPTEARIKTKRRISPFWLLPVIALMIAGWLIWTSYEDRGSTVTIDFQTADGIVAGRTPVRFQGVEVGTVQDISLGKGLNKIQVRVSIKSDMQDALRSETQFWLVTPKASLAGVSGLDALVGGNYIGMMPGKGEPQDHFVALDTQPKYRLNNGDLMIHLQAPDLGSLNSGSLVYFRKIPVGRVYNYAINPNKQGVTIDVLIERRFTNLVKKGSRFWNVSGVDADLSLSGAKVKLESLAALVNGAIAFDSPENSSPATADDSFGLYADLAHSQRGVIVKLALPDAKGLKAGSTPLMYQGLQVGQLTKMTLNPGGSVTGEMTVDPSVVDLLREKTRIEMRSPKLSLNDASLSTLLTGNTFELIPGEGEPSNSFVIAPADKSLLQKPGVVTVTLNAPESYGIEAGQPLILHGVQVGQVLERKLSANGVTFSVAIDPQYSDLVHGDSKFVVNSRVDVKVGLDGVEFLGALPLTMAIRQQTDSGTPTVVAEPEGPVAVIYKQIARTIARGLRLNEDLTEAISLAHDLGHTPFGHAGESALDKLCPEGFRHYMQSLRVVDKLEKDGRGLNLTWEVRNGIVTHTKGTWAATPEGRIVRMADQIAFVNHDIEDAVRAGVLDPATLPKECTAVLGETKSQRITAMINSILRSSEGDVQVGAEENEAFLALKDFMYCTVYVDRSAKKEEQKVEKVLTELYEYYLTHIEQMSNFYLQLAYQEGRDRAVTDYISGMSDEFAIRTFEDVFVPRKWHVL